MSSKPGGVISCASFTVCSSVLTSRTLVGINISSASRRLESQAILRKRRNLAPVQYRRPVLPCGYPQRAQPVAETEAGPQGGITAISVEIPTTAARHPNSMPHPPVQLLGEHSLRPGVNFDSSRAVAPKKTHAAQYMANLRLQHVHHRVVPEAGIGASQDKQVREARDGKTKAGRHAVVPCVGEPDAVAPANVNLAKRLRRTKPRCEDQDVRMVLFA